MKEKGFARGVRREDIKECERLGMSLEEFAELSLRAMQGIADQLGL
jgi:predicted hydrolase (HD superfamily)